jgi:2,4-dienoyl-CoA reductase-like NADH-dependent reductase (Old Yellow Enzyme family)
VRNQDLVVQVVPGWGKEKTRRGHVTDSTQPDSAAQQTVRLFEPIQLRDIVSRNRIMISPMSQYSAADSIPHDWHLVNLGSRAVGGAGIVMTEATAVEPRGRISPWDVGLWNDDQEAAFARIASFVAAQGAVPGIQLAHAGRKASHMRPWEDRKPIFKEDGGWDIVGPSPIPLREDDIVPVELTDSEIDGIIGRFEHSATRAVRAGFKLIEIHAAHGYLLHSFLSPLVNQRTDSYGGSFDQRIRIVLDVVQVVREVLPPELPLFVRLSVKDWADGGWEVEDSIELARRLAPIGVDLIDCSSGGAVAHQKIEVGPGYQVPLAEAVRKGAEIRTAAVGLISTPEQAEQILASGSADLIALGRMALWSPYWPHHAAKALGATVELPIQYARSGIYAKDRRDGSRRGGSQGSN